MESKDQIVLFVIAASIVGLTFGVFIILFLLRHQKKMHQNALNMQLLKQNQQRELFQAISDTELREKQRIANNLHDEIGITLNLIRQNLGLQKKELQPDSIALKINETNKTLLDKAHETLSTSIFELIPKFMLDNGLSNSLNNDFLLLSTNKSLETSYNNSIDFPFENHFSKNHLIDINRIVHEILNNILKYSGCTNLSLNIHGEASILKLIFSHNGKIISNEEIHNYTHTSNGLGLRSMKARLELLGGSVDYSSAGKEARVTFSIPFDPHSNLKHDQTDSNSPG